MMGCVPCGAQPSISCHLFQSHFLSVPHDVKPCDLLQAFSSFSSLQVCIFEWHYIALPGSTHQHQLSYTVRKPRSIAFPARNRRALSSPPAP